MIRPAWNNPYGFDASGSGDLTLPPPTMLTEAFVTAHTEVLRQLPQMPPLQQKVQPSKPCSPEVPTQRDINAIVGATQLLEGQNSVLSQMVYDVVQGRYGKPYQNSLADSLSQSLSTSMVEQARLFNLLEQYVNQDQPQASDSILPPSRLPMDLRAEERANRGNKRVLSEIDVSEWEITCTETRPHKGKRRYNTNKTTQLPASATPSRTTKWARKKERNRLRLIKKASQQISKPGDIPPRLCSNVDNPGITDVIVQITNIRIRTSEQLSVLKTSTRVFKESQIRLTLWVKPLSQNHFPNSSCSFESRDEILLKGGRL
jgi:hypothetical protein